MTSNCVPEVLQLNIDTIDVSISIQGMTMSANTTVQGTTYQWVDCDANNTPIPGAVNQFFTASDNGNYAVIITQGSCEVMSAYVNVSDVGMNENSTLVFTVFPNPSFDQITVQRSQSETGSFSMYDQQGRMVLSGQLERISTKISMDSLTAGTYLLKVGGIESPVLLIKN